MTHLVLLQVHTILLILLYFRHHREKRQKFLISNNAHPQTMAIVKTRAEALGIHLDVFNGAKEVFDGVKPLGEMFDLSEYCGNFFN